MKKQSAGILAYRFRQQVLEVFLVHPGGPFWQKKDRGVWSIPKGEFSDDEEPLAAARREFFEETGIRIEGPMLALSPLKQKSGKVVFAWAIEKDIEPGQVRSNTFETEWPPKSGRMRQFPEIDKAAWFDIPTARQKCNERQAALLDELLLKLDLRPGREISAP
ncbi:MAG: NUDIX domain-containing protein [Bacteroidia bacterium]|nr:NUDIX domain-containing protein [Bacteroidia bacterium]